MRKLLIVIAALACLAAVVVANNSVFTATQDIPKESKVQPKEVVLGKDSQSDKYGEVPFNHENHSTKSYSIDGQECSRLRRMPSHRPARCGPESSAKDG